MQRFIFIFLLFSAVFLDGREQLQLLEGMREVQVGDYVVSYQNKSYTLLHAIGSEDGVLELEERTIPSQFKEKGVSWREWLLRGAPGTSSHLRYRIDLADGRMLSYYSFTKRAWLAVDPENNLLSQLLDMELDRVPEEQRKRRGPPPLEGRDTRPFWSPPLTIEGKRVADATFSAWSGRWPKDGSELSNKRVLVYLPDDERTHLRGFPYWVEISGKIGRAHFRVVDSGNSKL